jgi:hypothetical protein
MKKSIIVILLFVFVSSPEKTLAQSAASKKSDTLIYKSIGHPIDTFYSIRQRIKKDKFEQTSYFGLSDNTNLSSSTDTFIVNKRQWKKIYGNQILSFLSIKSFRAKKKTYEYVDRVNQYSFYYEYTPIKKIQVLGKKFYVYRVRPMSGEGKSKGMVEGLGDDIRYIVFNFSVGEVYRTSYHMKKILDGYDKYLKYFVW